ncbi:ParA family protein [Lactiplantibacillus plantarum]|uniref:ParA family protein n=1 Tax=Lactiplantibacillus plantarum TaxID=1590 RepID=UPI0021A2D374|nr:AAA family ATPase [Lactiplantibacillus plantarum]MCT3221921.1 ParA family protein [Lactiplantibacillus plantarum]
MKTIAFFNNKGGVGKTTLSANLSAFFVERLHKRVLVLDCDPQSNITQLALGDDKWEKYYGPNPSRQTIKDVFNPIVDGDSTIQTKIDITHGSEHEFAFDLIPGHPELSVFEDKLSESWLNLLGGDIGGLRRTNWLKNIVEDYKSEYDYLIIDVGPSLGALNRSILLNSEYFITPMGSDIFSLMSLSNISKWMDTWMKKYQTAIELQFNESENLFSKYRINQDARKTTRYLGYSVQQYNARKFKTGKRPVKAYENIIKQMQSLIEENLSGFMASTVKSKGFLKLGDVPYLGSIVPMSQSTNTPLFALTSKEGLRGNQGGVVEDAAKMLMNITKSIQINMGEI